jgi:flagellar basal body-associated protein FliL
MMMMMMMMMMIIIIIIIIIVVVVLAVAVTACTGVKNTRCLSLSHWLPDQNVTAGRNVLFGLELNFFKLSKQKTK